MPRGGLPQSNRTTTMPESATEATAAARRNAGLCRTKRTITSAAMRSSRLRTGPEGPVADHGMKPDRSLGLAVKTTPTAPTGPGPLGPAKEVHGANAAATSNAAAAIVINSLLRFTLSRSSSHNLNSEIADGILDVGVDAAVTVGEVA